MIEIKLKHTLSERSRHWLSALTAYAKNLFFDSLLRLITQTPAVWILLSQGLAPQVGPRRLYSSDSRGAWPRNHPPDGFVLALERKADEPFATLRPLTHSPAVWILNFRVRYTISV
jgi:hypothetical protein